MVYQRFVEVLFIFPIFRELVMHLHLLRVFLFICFLLFIYQQEQGQLVDQN